MIDNKKLLVTQSWADLLNEDKEDKTNDHQLLLFFQLANQPQNMNGEFAKIIGFNHAAYLRETEAIAQRQLQERVNFFTENYMCSIFSDYLHELNKK